MADPELSFDMLAERGQYRAFQRAYGKENQAMLGLILLTVAWSYAAHVYGHAAVFTWFVRYLFAAVVMYVLYYLLMYGHSIFEKAARQYRTWERAQNDALRDSRARDKAKERRRRARENENMYAAESQTQKQESPQTEDHQENERSSSKLREDIEEAKARKLAAETEERNARKEVARSKKAEDLAAAAAKKAEWDAEQKQRAQAAERDAEHKQRAQTDAAVALAGAKVRDAEEALAVMNLDAEAILAQAQQETPDSDDSCTPGYDAFLHPDQVLSPQDQSPDVPPEEMTRAETAVAIAKQEALRAQRQLAMAEEVANRARTQNQGKAGKGGKAERRGGDSLKGLLRSTNSGSGYVPPHLRDGYTPKPAKEMLPPGYHDAGRDGARASNPGRKKSAATRAAGRQSTSKEGKGGDPESRSSGSKSPDSSSSVSPSPDERLIQKDPLENLSRGENVAKREQKKVEPVFESRNVFAMLPDEDDEDTE